MKYRILLGFITLMLGMTVQAGDVDYDNPLITDASQLSSDASDYQEGQHIEYLIDGDDYTFWHTDWHNICQDELHYLQVELATPYDGGMVLMMVRRNTSNDHPTVMRVEASNDASDWTYITDLDLPYEGQGTTVYSDEFEIPSPYKYLRFAATNCDGDNGWGWRKFWHAAEFQLYSTADNSIPFRPTKIVNGVLSESTHWYTMTIRGDKKVWSDGAEVYCTSNDEITPAHLWAFVGNKTDGFRIYNYLTGATKWVYVASEANRTYLSMVTETPSVGSDLFMLEDNTCGAYAFYYPGFPLSCWNDRSGHIGLYNNSNSIHDSGSNIVFEQFDVSSLSTYVSSLTLSPTAATVFPGKTLTLSCTVLPEDATNKTLKWSSSDQGVATVDANGVVTAVETGTAVITVAATDGSKVTATCSITVPDDSAVEPIEGQVRYIYLSDGTVKAYPKAYLKSQVRSGETLRLTLANGELVTYPVVEIDSMSYTQPADMATFTSFKFNNKFNDQLIGDADGEFGEGNVITASVLGIGKRLTPSFKLSSEDAAAYIGTKLQQSKVSRLRFDKDITYTVAHRGSTILRKTLSGDYMELPLGTEYTVHVDFLTDHSTSTYNVPSIYIETEGGQMISSRETYLNASIRVDGGGVFPDMENTSMQIRGRGNSSWAGTWGKSPYRMKFDTKVKMLGLTKGKNWNLIANAQTQSMTTNAIGQRIAQMVGAAAANHEIPVELYINGNYRGSYNLTEKVGFSNNSVDLDDETNAVLLELDSYYDEPYKFMSSKYDIPVNIKEPDLSEGTSPLTKEGIQSHFNSFINAIYSKTDVEKYVDLDYMARYLMVNDMILNFEFMHPKSTYIYNEDINNPDSKYIWGPVWDLDWGYGYEGTSTYFQQYATRNYWSGCNMEMDKTGFPKAVRYSGDATNRAYYRVWTDFMKNDLDELLEFCDDYYQFAAPSFDHDNQMWYNGGASTYAGVTERSKEWLKTRAEYIYDFLSNTQGYADRDYLVDDNPAITKGDVNEDGIISTADVVCILNYILGKENEDFTFSQADTDDNNLITIADAMYVLAQIPQEQKIAAKRMSMPEADAKLKLQPVTLQPGLTADVPVTLSIEEDGQYCGAQFDVAVPTGVQLSNLVLPTAISDYSTQITPLGDNLYRVSLYGSAQSVFPQGTNTLHLMLDANENLADGLGNLCFTNVLISNTEGEEERLNANSTRIEVSATGVADIAALSVQGGNQLVVESLGESMLNVYSVDGRMVRQCRLHAGSNTLSLPRGIYVVNNQKVIIR